MIDNDPFCAKEELIWERCIAWCKHHVDIYNVNTDNNHNSDNSDNSANSISWKQLMLSFKDSIRYTSMDSKYFVKNVSQLQILTKEEAFEISLKLIDNSYQIKPQFNFNCKKRSEYIIKSNRDWKWDPSSPPRYPNLRCYTISNNNKTINQISQTYTATNSINPWISTHDTNNKIISIKVDNISNNCNQYNAIGVITSRFWSQCQGIDCDQYSNELIVLPLNSAYSRTLKNTYQIRPDNIIQIIINCDNKAVTFKIFNNSNNMKLNFDSGEQAFNQIGKQDLCVAVSAASKTGWRFTIIDA